MGTCTIQHSAPITVPCLQAKIAKALKPHGCGVATGEVAQNRVIFKQLMQAEAISFCQIDSCRIGVFSTWA